ncbi:MAG: ABC transporter permease [Gammaproteobacteria bacterium]|nr:ABC transporter permease [Gammaproteobacteria bacterium]
MMRTYLAGVQREFWENQGSFIYLPLVITALLLVVCSYIVIRHASPDSQFGMGVFGQFSSGDTAVGDVSGEGTPVPAGAAEAPVEYIVDFEKGALAPVPGGSSDKEFNGNGEMDLNDILHGIHLLFINIMGIALIAYLLNTLYSDREDRSILFWKSLPVSETRNVLTKLFVAVIAVPVLATVISWLAQIGYVVLALIFAYRLDLNPWTAVWSRLDLLQAFFNEIVFVLWVGFWMLPFTAWLLIASAWARRVPFLIAILPFVVVIIFEKLLFDTSIIAGLLAEQFQIVSIQMGNFMQETATDIQRGTIDLALAVPRMITGLLIAGVLLPATIWLRNHRFEI